MDEVIQETVLDIVIWVIALALGAYAFQAFALYLYGKEFSYEMSLAILIGLKAIKHTIIG